MSRVEPQRVRVLHQRPEPRGAYVLYWMQQSQRVAWNHALCYAIEQANARRLPVVVAFGLTTDYPEANLRHYHFMLEGLQQVRRELAERGIAFVLELGEPAEVALRWERRAAMIVCDRGYLRHQKRWREQVAREARCAVVQVESDVVVPVEQAADRALVGARSLRPRIHRELEGFLKPLALPRVRVRAQGFEGVAWDAVEDLLERMELDTQVTEVSRFYRGGTQQARAKLRAFVRERLPGYAANRARPEADHVSLLGMHLHFGQIAPVQIALAAREARAAEDDRASLLEELIVRRELAINFVHFTPNYDRYACIPGWARATLDEHRHDPRPAIYTARELEAGRTDDPYWNAAMNQMRHTGYLHNHMRMYWGKQIIRWTRTPEHAYRVTLWLNNRYFLDGRDPNSYANVAWLFGVHDRPWPERAIFGKVRTMTASGLKRKADPDAYVRKVQQMLER